MAAAQSPKLGSCPIDPTPGDCAISSQFQNGRISFTQVNGTYTLGGTEAYYEDGRDFFDVSGQLSVELVDGADANFLDIDCDGNITGQGKDKISGSVIKTFDDSELCANGTKLEIPPNESSWNIEIERSYAITGMVTGTGEVELDLSIDTATMRILSDSNFVENPDCLWWDWTDGIEDLDVSGYTEKITLSDSNYDPETSSNWNPELSVRDSQSWLERMGQHLVLNAYYGFMPMGNGNFDKPGLSEDPKLLEPPYYYNELLFQNTVTADYTSDLQADSKTPVISDLALDQEKYFLLGVDVDVGITVTVDWKESDAPRQIEFNYGGSSETIDASGETTTWHFNAGQLGTDITAKALSSSGDSLEWTISTHKVNVPGWAGTSLDWSGSSNASSIDYQATLDWPVSLETSQTVDSISLMTGLWGVSGSISSEFNSKANSNGSPTTGDMNTDANLNLAGNDFSFQMQGNNTTTLMCNSMDTQGSASAQFPALEWQKTMNPITVIPGLSPAVCGLSGALCDLINSFGIKGDASVNITGQGSFTGENAEIQWDSGQLGGDISAQISVNAVPKALRSLADIGVEGGGSGCIDFQFSPEFELQTLGGEVNVGATVSFFGFGANPSHDWPFGDACSARISDRIQSSPGWVPADGQLAMASSGQYGAAIWSALPDGQERPSGDLMLRLWDGNAWQDIVELSNDVEADMAPSAAFDRQGNLHIVYQRSTASLPASIAEIPSFANALELHYMVIDPSTTSVTFAGQITHNNLNDFGANIQTDSSGALHVFWQRANGEHIFGDTNNAVSLHSSSLNSDDNTWSTPQTIADNLQFTFGWSAAAHSDSEMFLALIMDNDENFATQDDREIYLIQKTQGIWQAPEAITNNMVNDDAPQAAYQPDGTPHLLWRNDVQILSLSEDLLATPTIAFASPDSLLDDGIGQEFEDGFVFATPLGMATIWPHSTHMQTNHNWSDAGWRYADNSLQDSGVQQLHAAQLSGIDLLVAYAQRSFDSPQQLSNTITPKFARLPLLPDLIFGSTFDSAEN